MVDDKIQSIERCGLSAVTITVSWKLSAWWPRILRVWTVLYV